MNSESHEEKYYWLQQQSNGAIVLMVFAILLVLLHLYALQIRRDQRNIKIGWNCGLIIASLVAFMLHCAAVIVNARAYTRYFKTLDKAERSKYFVAIGKSSYAMSATYPLTFTLPKLMICVLYLQIFAINNRARQITIGLIAFLIINFIAWFLPSVAVCRPVSAFWSPQGHRGKCLNYNIFGTWISLPNIASDLFMLVLPMPILWKMKISAFKKLGLMVTFAIGCGGIVGACLRFGIYIHRTYIERHGVNQTTKSIVITTIVSYIECGLYLIAACLPMLRIMFVHLRDILGKNVEPFLQRYRNPDGPSSNPRVDMKLTGIGNLKTLMRRGNQVGVSLTDSVINEKIPITARSASRK